ncbi:helix-turn-helix domain-containing protein [bacterium SCSIO 12827]|nr:helix-turn-helix domain-containing protein [bacterium SCSIO 12827]
MNAISKSQFSTTRLPADQRFDVWRESISALFDVTPPVRAAMDGFDASLTSFLLNDQIMFSRCETKAQRFERDSLRASKDGLDHFLIQTHLKGGQEVRRGRHHSEAAVGDLLIIDLAERHMAETSDFSHLTLVVPRPLLAPYLRRPDSQQCRVLKGIDPLTAMAVNHLKMLFSMSDGLTEESAALSVEPTLALMASALNGSADDVENAAAAAAASLLHRTKTEIERNLASPDLSVSTLCSAVGLSRAGLYRLFAPYGGVRAYIQDRRLRRAAADLVSPSQQQKYVYDIAFNWGFASEAHFSRAFKARFGMSPKDARDLGRTGMHMETQMSDTPQIGDRNYEIWLSQTLKI